MKSPYEFLETQQHALHGDGRHDDTAGLQARIDVGGADVYFPPPADHYLIGGPLVIHSGQTLHLDNLTRIRLAPRADTVMLTNDDHEGGNEGISLIGGIWDMDNRSQSPNPFLDHGDQLQYSPEHYIGVLMRLVNVRNLTIRGLTLRDPVTFGIQLAKLENFTIEDITFDYTHCNPIFLNMDGVHIAVASAGPLWYMDAGLLRTECRGQRRVPAGSYRVGECFNLRAANTT